jgi:hypothetical protein
MTENCSGLKGSLASVQWIQVPDVKTVGDPNVTSYWSAASNRIVIAGDLIYKAAIVRHEMLHALLARDGHPREYFVEKCGGAVTCSASCVADAGPPAIPDASVARVNASVLSVNASLMPELPSFFVDNAQFTLVVTATNPLPNPIVVQLTQGAFDRSFNYAFVQGAVTLNSGWGTLADFDVTQFAAGETKVAYFDFSLNGPLGSERINPGIYRITSGYDTRRITLNSIRIGQ